MRKRERSIIFAFEALFILISVLSVLFPIGLIFTFIPLVILSVYFWSQNMRTNFVVLAIAMIIMCIVTLGDILYVVFTVMLIMGVVGAILGLKQRRYIMGALITALFMLFSALIPFVFYAQMQGKNLGAVASDYVAEKLTEDDMIFSPSGGLKGAAKVYYHFNKTPDGGKLSPDDEGYDKDVISVFSAKVNEWGQSDILYDLLSFSATAALMGYLFALILYHNPIFNKNSSGAPFVVDTDYVKFIDMRLNRKYMLVVFLPMMLLSMLSFVSKGASDVIAAIVNASVTVPGAFAGLTLLFHTGDRTPVALKTVIFILFSILGIASVFLSVPRFILSLLGLADALLNVRKLLDYALSKDKNAKLDLSEKPPEKRRDRFMPLDDIDSDIKKKNLDTNKKTEENSSESIDKESTDGDNKSDKD